MLDVTRQVLPLTVRASHRRNGAGSPYNMSLLVPGSAESHSNFRMTATVGCCMPCTHFLSFFGRQVLNSTVRDMAG